MFEAFSQDLENGNPPKLLICYWPQSIVEILLNKVYCVFHCHNIKVILYIFGFVFLSDYQTRKTKHRWTDYCQGIMSMLTLNELTYTVQPRPEVTKVDLAGAFLSTEKFLSEGLYFSNFTNRRKYPCLGCQDGYLTQHLVTHRYWTYERLPIDGLRSIVFHGPSPTWCIASGNVWFDHPKSGQVRCYPPYVLQALRKIDSSHQSIFDWDYYEHHDRVCLRFSAFGYGKFTESQNHPKSKVSSHHRSLLDNLP